MSAITLQRAPIIHTMAMSCAARQCLAHVAVILSCHPHWRAPQVRALRMKESYEADLKRLENHIANGLRIRSEKKQASAHRPTLSFGSFQM